MSDRHDSTIASFPNCRPSETGSVEILHSSEQRAGSRSICQRVGAKAVDRGGSTAEIICSWGLPIGGDSKGIDRHREIGEELLAEKVVVLEILYP